MGKRIATTWIVGLALAASSAQMAFGQRRAVSEAEALSYISSAFLTQADPGVMGKQVVLGPELQKGLSLPANAEGAKVYEALIGLAGKDAFDVRRATPQEVGQYGARRGFDPAAAHPLYALEAGKMKFLVQYDLRSVNIAFVGQLGVPDPDPRPVAAPAPLALAAARPADAKGDPVTLAWTGLFEFGAATLSEEGRAKLDAEIVPKLGDLAQIRYLNVSGHADRVGAADHNQRLSEKRAEAVRDYLVAKGVDPDRIETFGYGQTMPVKSCRDETRRSGLIQCLAPNRRVVVEVQGMPRSPAPEAKSR